MGAFSKLFNWIFVDGLCGRLATRVVVYRVKIQNISFAAGAINYLSNILIINIYLIK